MGLFREPLDELPERDHLIMVNIHVLIEAAALVLRCEAVHDQVRVQVRIRLPGDCARFSPGAGEPVKQRGSLLHPLQLAAFEVDLIPALL